MQILYALEQQMREEKLDWEDKTKLRQEKSVPVLLELKEWMTQQLPLVIPRGGRQKVPWVRLLPTAYLGGMDLVRMHCMGKLGLIARRPAIT
jgi:hypothetical protein